MIGTTHDPAAPYANARRVADLLGNAMLLTHDGYGHTSEADASQCVVHTTSAYLVQLTSPPKGTICRSDRSDADPQGIDDPATSKAPPNLEAPLSERE